MIPDRGPDKVVSRPADPDVCRCECHQGEPVFHLFLCCHRCEVCRQRIRATRMGAHVRAHCEPDPADHDASRWHDDGGR